jgi:hypothetical protein
MSFDINEIGAKICTSLDRRKRLEIKQLRHICTVRCATGERVVRLLIIFNLRADSSRADW